MQNLNTYYIEFDTRKGEHELHCMQARDKMSARDYFRRKGPKNIRIVRDTEGFVCKNCRHVINGFGDGSGICDECKEKTQS